LHPLARHQETHSTPARRSIPLVSRANLPPPQLKASLRLQDLRKRRPRPRSVRAPPELSRAPPPVTPAGRTLGASRGSAWPSGHPRPLPEAATLRQPGISSRE
jgi:hypothetical protein